MSTTVQEDSYACPKCSLTPKIISLYRNTIQLECPIHGNMSLDLNSYMQQSSRNSYFGKTCGICNTNKQINDQNIFKYCYDCDKVICYQCIYTHQKNFPGHNKIIFSKEYNTKCYIHKGENYEEFCYTCNRNICNSCFNEHKSHDRESLIGLDEEIVEGDISIIDLRKTFLENVRNKLLEEINQIEECIQFYNLIVKTKLNVPNNGYHVQNVNILARDLDSQYEYKDKNKEIDNLQKELNSLKVLDQVRDKYISDFNNKYSTNISKDDTKLDLSNKNIKNDGLKMLSRINFTNLKELNLSKNELSSFKCLHESNLKNLEVLKLDNNRINSIEVLPYLNCLKLKEIDLNNNKLCNIDSLENLIDFNDLEIIDIRNNNYDKKLEKNEKLIKDLKQMIKTVKVDDGDEDNNEPEITDEELNEMLK